MEKLKVKELESAFARIIEKLNFEGVKEIDFPFDFYRVIPSHKLAVNYLEDDEYNVGSLEDDVASLKKMVTDKEIPCTYVDFDRVASILTIVSEDRNPSA